MERIASFSVDHDKLETGVHVSRIDDNIVTYDLRFIKPNTPPYLENAAIHTIEHLFATYARNSELSDKIVYFGPMGCRTGFYLLLKDVENSIAKSFIKEIICKCKEHTGEIPGAKKIECGNYLEHNLSLAKSALNSFYLTLCE